MSSFLASISWRLSLRALRGVSSGIDTLRVLR